MSWFNFRLELNQPPVFALASHLMSSDTELHYLRQISELIVMFLMPRCYSLTPVSYLVREILACKSVYLYFYVKLYSLIKKSY